jgi:hypothetical protein
MNSLCLPLLLLFSSALATPQGGLNNAGNDRGNFGSPSSTFSNAQSGPSSFAGGVDVQSSEALRKRALIAHAVLASTAWAFFSPVGSIFLRLNINHPVMLKLHILFQLLAYLSYVAATGLGIYLALQIEQFFDIWSDPHLILGFVILGFATTQPATGWIHHRIFRSRAIRITTTSRGPRPGRTSWGRTHLWIGRLVITAAIINGGLGLKLTEGSPTQDIRVTRNAEIGYGVAAGLMWCLYMVITLIWECRRSASKQTRPYQDYRRHRNDRSPPLSNQSLQNADTLEKH